MVDVSTDTSTMTTVRITPARERFLTEFNQYTANGRNPHTLDGLWKEFKTQPRVINYCRRNGLLVKSAFDDTYVVSLEAKRLAKIATETMKNVSNSLDSIVRRRSRKRSSAMMKQS